MTVADAVGVVAIGVLAARCQMPKVHEANNESLAGHSLRTAKLILDVAHCEDINIGGDIV